MGAPNGTDPFDNANNWTLFNNDCFATTITGGKFVMEAKGAPELSCWEVSWPLIKDYYYQSEVVMPAVCNANDRFGLFFRAPDNDRGFLFGVQCDGKYSLSNWDGETTNERSCWAIWSTNMKIKTATGTTSRNRKVRRVTEAESRGLPSVYRARRNQP